MSIFDPHTTAVSADPPDDPWRSPSGGGGGTDTAGLKGKDVPASNGDAHPHPPPVVMFNVDDDSPVSFSTSRPLHPHFDDDASFESHEHGRGYGQGHAHGLGSGSGSSSRPAGRRPPSHRRSTSLASPASIASLQSLGDSIKSVRPPKNALARLIVPLLILLSISVASMAQTEVAHYLVADVGYNQPYFAFFLTHVSFTFVFPIHLLFLYILRPSVSPLSHLRAIRQVIASQLSLPRPHDRTWKDVLPGWSRKILGMTVLISLPALAWFIAVVFTTAMDVTTIYATSSFYAYFFSMLLLRQPLSRVTVCSICLAFGGVLVIVLAGAAKDDGEGGEEGGGAKNRVLGDIVMTIGAILLGLYEVVYKLALPEGHGGVSASDDTNGSAEEYSALPLHANHDHGITEAEDFELDDSPASSPRMTRSHSTLKQNGGPSHRPSSGDRSRPGMNRSRSDDIPLSRRSPKPSLLPKTSATPLLTSNPDPTAATSDPESEDDDEDDLKPPNGTITHHPGEEVKLPPALHANFFTTCIGITTILLLWIPIPILDTLGWEGFRWPGSQGGPELKIWLDLAVVAWGGAIYNAGLMVLIGIWGPTTSSVANLLTIGLVAVFDAVWMGSVPDLQTLAGVAMICIGFGILLWEGEG